MSNFDFEWEEVESTENFFDETFVEETEDQNKDVDSPEEEDEDLEDDSEENENLFEESDQEYYEDDEEEEDTAPESVKVFNILSEKGFISVDLEEDEEITEERAEELIEDGFENEIEKRIEDKLLGLPEDAQTLLQFVLKGGSVSDYIKTVKDFTGGSVLTENLDLDDEDNQEAVIREIMLQEDNDPEDVEFQIETLRDNGKMKAFAERRYNKWLKQMKSKKAEMMKKQAAKNAEMKMAERENRRKLTALLNSEEIGGLQITREEKQSLPSFLNDKSVKLANGAMITEMQKELFSEIPKNQVAMLQLAILMKNRNEDGTFNFDRIAKKVATEVTNKIKKNVRRSKNGLPASGTKKQRTGRTLADILTNN